MMRNNNPSKDVAEVFPNRLELFRAISNKSQENEEEDGQGSHSRTEENKRFPKTECEADQVENLLADELGKLSVAENERLAFDVHGIALKNDEDPSDVDAKLVDLETKLRCFPLKKKSAYEHALYVNEDYVRSRSFRLMFLRSERFDTKLAAEKIVHYFELKEELFANSFDDGIMGRDIRLSDMDDDDRVALESGVLQPQAERDIAGRAILLGYPARLPEDISFQSMARMAWYLLHSMLKDEETQKKGMVAVIYNVGKGARRRPHPHMKKIKRIHRAIPKKGMGVHFCYDDASLRPYVVGTRLFLPSRGQALFRDHFGRKAEFEMLTFGIPARYCVIEQDDKDVRERHQKWLEACQAQEEQQSTSSVGITTTLTPRRFDVLFGRGKAFQEHTGNLRAAHLVDMNVSTYESAGKFEKTAIAERIVNVIHESHGRFLKWEDGGWVEVDRDAAREKISHFFRHLRSKGIAPSSTHSNKRGAGKKKPVGRKRKQSPAKTKQRRRRAL